MKLIDFETIRNANIAYNDYYNWMIELMKQKPDTILPPKISMKTEGHIFYNVMPSIIPNENIAGVKVVTRYPLNIPSLSADILLYDFKTSKPIGLFDGTYITMMRTGAIAALAINTLAKKNYKNIAIVGLGNTARTTLLMLIASNPGKHFDIKLKQYDNQAEIFAERFKDYDISFEIIDDEQEFYENSDVIVSCVTYAEKNMCKDEWFTDGCLVVPVHTMGFQNCDLLFDKEVVDDIGHVNTFKYFDKFKECVELSDVLNGKCAGRDNENQKIIAYNIGLSIEDIYTAYKVFEKLNKDNLLEFKNQIPEEKYWV